MILEEIMDNKGLSVADVARLCDLPDSTVRAIIKRKSKTVAIDVAFKLSKGLNVSLERLNGLEEQKKSAPAQGEDTLTKAQQELLNLLDTLSEERQKEVMNYIRFLQDQSNQ